MNAQIRKIQTEYSCLDHISTNKSISPYLKTQASRRQWHVCYAIVFFIRSHEIAAKQAVLPDEQSISTTHKKKAVCLMEQHALVRALFISPIAEEQEQHHIPRDPTSRSPVVSHNLTTARWNPLLFAKILPMWQAITCVCLFACYLVDMITPRFLYVHQMEGKKM